MANEHSHVTAPDVERELHTRDYIEARPSPHPPIHAHEPEIPHPPADVPGMDIHAPHEPEVIYFPEHEPGVDHEPLPGLPPFHEPDVVPEISRKDWIAAAAYALFCLTVKDHQLLLPYH